MKIINSLNNPYIKELSKLNEKKYREKEGKFLIEGYNIVKEAKDADILIEVLIVDEKDIIEGIPCIKVTQEIIKKIADAKTPQNIIGICKMKKEKELSSDKILLLDNLQDPGNFGTLIRSALSFGVFDVVVSLDSVDLYNPKFIRSTQGAFFKINILRRNLNEVIEELKLREYTILGTDVNNAKKLQDIPKLDKYALILGSEGNGVNKKLLEKTDYNITIETTKLFESLNVAIAGSIIMYYLQWYRLLITNNIFIEIDKMIDLMLKH